MLGSSMPLPPGRALGCPLPSGAECAVSRSWSVAAPERERQCVSNHHPAAASQRERVTRTAGNTQDYPARCSLNQVPGLSCAWANAHLDGASCWRLAHQRSGQSTWRCSVPRTSPPCSASHPSLAHSLPPLPSPTSNLGLVPRLPRRTHVPSTDSLRANTAKRSVMQV